MKRLLFPTLLSLVLLFGFCSLNAKAAPANEQDTNGHSDCQTCHSMPNMVGRFQNGETFSLLVDETHVAESIHGKLGCQACHYDTTEYPHPFSSQSSCVTCHSQIMDGQSPPEDQPLVFDLALESPRALSLELNRECKRCHEPISEDVVDSDHMQIMEQGNIYAPVCVDCHEAHNVVEITDANRSMVPEICGQCHQAAYTTYESSVHGAALAVETNPDVPTCGNCHGTHVVRGPDQVNFRADSIILCGNCHADETRMGKYGISTDVFTTYLDDFHGRSVSYAALAQGMEVNKATCYDCHGVHNIMAPENERSTVFPSNLQSTCKKCHPDASITFPQAWLSHKIPDRNNSPILFFVNQFFKYLIAVSAGFCAIYILLDGRRRIADRIMNSRSKHMNRIR